MCTQKILLVRFDEPGKDFLLHPCSSWLYIRKSCFPILKSRVIGIRISCFSPSKSVRGDKTSLLTANVQKRRTANGFRGGFSSDQWVYCSTFGANANP